MSSITETMSVCRWRNGSLSQSFESTSACSCCSRADLPDVDWVVVGLIDVDLAVVDLSFVDLAGTSDRKARGVNGLFLSAAGAGPAGETAKINAAALINANRRGAIDLLRGRPLIVQDPPPSSVDTSSSGAGR